MMIKLIILLFIDDHIIYGVNIVHIIRCIHTLHTPSAWSLLWIRQVQRKRSYNIVNHLQTVRFIDSSSY